MQALAIMLMTTALGFANTAQAQQATAAFQFDSEADADSGAATQTLLGLLPQTISWGPDAQSITDLSGSNSAPSPSIAENINGVSTYQSYNNTDSTDAADSGGSDDGDANVSTGTGSALGGLVSWANLFIKESCAPDSNIAQQVDCSTYASITDLSVDGKLVPAGNYNPGAVIPITGNIPDANCPLGIDSFNGSLVLDNSIVSDGTPASDTEIAVDITGTATCLTAGLLPLYTTSYSEQIGGPQQRFNVPPPLVPAQAGQDVPITVQSTHTLQIF